MADINSYTYQQEHDRVLAQSVCVAAVVQVLAFDPSKMTVDVQPLSKQLENGKYESQPQILNVPIAVTRGGGFLFRPWYRKGDVGVVVYIDHDIDDALADGKESSPSTERNHSTSDAVFIGGIVAGDYESKDLPEESIVLSTEDGSVYIAIQADKLEVKNNGTSVEFRADGVKIDTPGTLDLTADGAVTIRGATVNIN